MVWQMSILRGTLGTTAVAALLVGAAPEIAAAASINAGPPRYRVVGIRGNAALKMRVRPTHRSRVRRRIRFNARGIRNLYRSRGQWRLVRYRGASGWVPAHFLYEDNRLEPVYYAVTGLRWGSRLRVRRWPWHPARIVGTIASHATAVEARGTCLRRWCPISYKSRRRWVHRRYLITWRP